MTLGLNVACCSWNSHTRCIFCVAFSVLHMSFGEVQTGDVFKRARAQTYLFHACQLSRVAVLLLALKH